MGAIVGIVVGILLFIVALVILICFLYKEKLASFVLDLYFDAVDGEMEDPKRAKLEKLKLSW